jgi:hypothetical protein
MKIFITTTGLTPSIILNDLGERIFAHPTTDYEISLEYNYFELQTSFDFNDSLDFGYITASYNGTLVNNSNDFTPIIESSIIFGVTGATGATGPQGEIGATGPQGEIGPTGATPTR